MKYSVATIGFFDGVHLGHQKLISIVKDLANKAGYRSLLFTFDKTLKSKNLIYSFKDKLRILNSFNLNKVIVLNFKKVKNLTPQKFFEKYIVKNKVKMLVVGEDFKFGKGATAGVKELWEMTENNGISLLVIKDFKVSLSNKLYSVSSTLVREKILASKFEEVKALLGREYFIEGKVIKGCGIGKRVLGIPTLNISPQELVLPQGVILGITEINNKKYPSVANFGYSPTFNKKKFLVEIHVLEKELKTREKFLKFYPLKKIRDEKFFSSVSALKNRILKDIAFAKKFFNISC